MELSLRQAAQADASHIAALVNLSAQGLPSTLWAAQADFRQDPMEVGRDIARREDNVLSWRNGVIAEVQGRVAGLVMSYLIAPEPVVIDSGTHPVYRPLIRLQNQALQSRYVNALAVYPEYQNKGIAARLMANVEERPGPGGTSVMVLNNNAVGQGFYASLGYEETARLPLIKADWQTDSTEWVLMRKT